MAGKEFQKFKKYVNWCRDADLYCVPNILTQDLDKFPEAKAWLQIELKEGRFDTLDLHGFDHGPYAGRSVGEISEHLDKALTWFEAEFDLVPIRFVTPHGANSPEIQEAAAKFDLIVETCDPPVIDQKVADGQLRASRELTFLDDKIIMCHWWERGLALYRITQSIKHGSVDAAIAETKNSLSAKDWGICWKNWV